MTTVLCDLEFRRHPRELRATEGSGGPASLIGRWRRLVTPFVVLIACLIPTTGMARALEHRNTGLEDFADRGPGCGADAATLCLSASSEVFETSATLTDGHGTAAGSSLPVESDPSAGAFAFRDIRYGEILVRVVDGCAVNSRYWVFVTSLTDLPYSVTVTQIATGATQVYTSPGGTRPTFSDVNAFSDCPASRRPASGEGSLGISSDARELVASGLPSSFRGLTSVSPRGFFCSADADTACLYGTRFPVELDWSSQLSSGSAMALAPNLAERTAGFTASVSTLEIAVKIVETCGHYEVHWASLLTYELDIQIDDYSGGSSWSSPPGTDANGVDREAFVNVPGCLFVSGFEPGNAFEWSASSP